MSKCIIIGNGELGNDVIIKNNDDLLIACDGGYDLIKNKRKDVDYIVGDMDSIKEVPKNIKTVQLNKVKDTTDVFEAVKLGIEKQYKVFYLYCCLGKRLEHSLANIQILLFIKKCDLKGFLIKNKQFFEVLSNETKELDKDCKGYFSLFSLSNKSTISITNAKYNLNRKVISNSFPLGIDNEFIGESVEIKVHKGDVLLIYENIDNN